MGLSAAPRQGRRRNGRVALRNRVAIGKGRVREGAIASAVDADDDGHELGAEHARRRAACIRPSFPMWAAAENIAERITGVGALQCAGAVTCSGSLAQASQRIREGMSAIPLRRPS